MSIPDFLADIDPLKWLDDLATTFRFGLGKQITWSPATGATGGQVEMLLRKYGVKVLARQYTNNSGRDYGVTVKPSQHEWAQYLLDQHLAGGKMPQAWGVAAAPVGLLGRVAGWLAGGIN